MSKKDKEKKLWDGITDEDFRNESYIEEDDIAQYDLEKMKIFSANINYFRQIIRLSDSLKPVERRILYAMYLMGAKPNTKSHKCVSIEGDTMKFHCHGNMSIYASLVNMAQQWKKQCPYIEGIGNFGNDAYSEHYAQSRYTEALISKYAWECFFEDYDSECVEVLESTTADDVEPMSFPSKFPNILINGGMGIAIGNSFCIPPYNVNEVISMTKKLIANPDYPEVYMVPDLPSGCDIIDDGSCLKEICDKGSGSLRMRGKTEIIDNGKTWVIRFTSIPWLSSLTSIDNKIIELAKSGVLPIKDIQNQSYQIIKENDNVRMKIDYRIIIDKNHDPYKIRDKLFSATELEKTLPVRFKVVLDNLTLGLFSMRDLILEWIDGRREYKRRLLNKKISRIYARLAILEILIRLLDKDNLEKTVSIIKKSTSAELVENLRSLAEMSSYQALKIAGMGLSAFTKDARDKYIQEKEKLINDLTNIMDLVKSEKKIDNIILEELDDLKKYGSPRKSEVISADSGEKVANTDHVLIFTHQDYIKKLSYNKENPTKTPVFGAFKNLDYPAYRLIVNNMDNIVIFDSKGRFTRTPVHNIDACDPSSMGISAYDATRLNGHIVSVFNDFNPSTEDYVKKNLNTNVYLVTLTKKGYMKKTELSEFNGGKSSRNISAMKIRDDDEMIFASLIMDSSYVMIYTKKGEYTMLPANEIPLMSKATQGLLSVKLEDEDDECVGMSVIGDKDSHILVVTEKGGMKKCELTMMSVGKRKSGSYLANVQPNDGIIFADGMNEKSTIYVCTRQDYFDYKFEDIAELSRRAKCPKKVPLPVGVNIISVGIK